MTVIGGNLAPNTARLAGNSEHGLQDSVHNKTACHVLGRDIVARRLPILGE